MGGDVVLIWDFDGTLGYREHNWEGAMVEVLAEYFPGRGFDRDLIISGLNSGFPWHESSKYYPELRDARQWWKAVNRVFVRIFLSLGLSMADAGRLSEKVRPQYLSIDKWKLYSDSIHVLHGLQDLGFQQYLVSNHVPELPEILKTLNIHHFFKGVFVSSLVGYNKPNPLIIGKSDPNLLSCENVYVIGDRYESDILMAREMGKTGILVRAHDERAAFQFENLTALEAFLTSPLQK